MDRGILLRAGRNRDASKGKVRRAIDWETDLIDTFETVVHRDFPNPKRVGCPGPDSLVALAACRTDAQATLVLDHIRQCAPCFDELKQLRKTQSERRI